MQSEISKQELQHANMNSSLARGALVHISGLLFVFLAQFIGGFLISIYAFMIAASFLLYSQIIIINQKRLVKWERLISSKSNTENTTENDIIKRPFVGSFWFYFAFFITFIIFPLNIASASCAILAVGDCLSGLVGRRFGKHKIIGNKSIEGSVVFLLSSFLVALIFISPLLAIIGAVIAMFVELITEQSLLKRKHANDNLLIPIIISIILYLSALM